VTTPAPLVVTRHQSGDADVLALGGELDIATADTLRTEFAALRDTLLPTLVVDLNDVTFMDSTGVGMLVAMRRWLQAHDRELVLAAAGGQPVKILRLVGLDQVCTIVDRVEDRIAVTPED
jgi:anti-sigma B factor antagonist